MLSQAFDRRLPILEANSQRVLSRLFGRAEDPRQGPARRWLWQAAEAVLPARGAGAFNQALMELGALVCVPVNPHCGENVPGVICASRVGSIDMSAPITPLTTWYLKRPASVSASAANPRLVMTLISAAGVGCGAGSPFGWVTIARAAPAKAMTKPMTASREPILKGKRAVKLMGRLLQLFPAAANRFLSN